MLTLILMKLFEISLHASFLVLAILLIRLIFKKLSRNFVCLLWMLVAVRLVFPFEITSGFSLQPNTDRVLELAGITSAEQSDHPEHITDTALSDNFEFTSGQNFSDTSAHGSTITQPGDTYSDNATVTEDRQPSDNVQNNQTKTTFPIPNTPASTIDIQDILATIWMIGTVIILSYGLISYVRTRQLLSEAVWLPRRGSCL